MDKVQNEQRREFLKDHIRLEMDFATTDQSQGVPPPPIAKPCPPDVRRIALAGPGEWKGIGSVDLERAIADRESCRTYSAEALSLDEIAFLLWATQGIRKHVNEAVSLTRTPVPSPPTTRPPWTTSLASTAAMNSPSTSPPSASVAESPS